MTEKVTAKTLEIGQAYLHKNGYWYRIIKAIKPGVVFYWCDFTNCPCERFSWYMHSCSPSHFARTCPTVCSKEKMEEIDAHRKRMGY